MELLYIIAIVVVMILFVLPTGFLLGRWFDLYWQIKMKRRWLKKPYLIARLVDKDTKSEQLKGLNLQRDLFSIGEYTFLSNANRIYRQDKEEVGIFVTKKNIKWEEGVPVITLDRDTLEPLEYNYGNKTGDSIKPNELQATIGAHDAIELQKSLLGKNNMQMYLMIILLLAGISAILGYASMDASNQCTTAVHSVCGNTTTITLPNGIVNGQTIIKGPGVK
jgi:hypothetical protein